MIELLISFLFQIVLVVPGAFILWALRKSEGSFADIASAKAGNSAMVGFIFWVVVVAGISVIARMA